MGRSPTIEDLYRDHSRSVYAFLVSLCRDPVWAEDLMQDTFAKATRSLAGYRGETPGHGYSRSHEACSSTTSANADPNPRIMLRRHPSQTPDVVELDAIQRALAALPDRQHTALLLADHAGIPYREIAGTLDATEGAIKVLVHRARRRFSGIWPRNAGASPRRHQGGGRHG